MILISHQTRSVVAPYDAAMPQLFPHGVRIKWNGEEMFVMDHGMTRRGC